MGLVVAGTCLVKMLTIDKLYNEVTLTIALVVSGVLFLAIIMAKLIGCILPVFAKKIGLDPAVMASPFITTIVDALSLITYCAVAIAIL